MPTHAVRKVKRVSRDPNFWPIVQLCATLVMIMLVGYIVWVASTEHAARASREAADKKAQVTECFNRNRQGPAGQRFFDALAAILQNQITAAQSVTSRSGPNREAYEKILIRAEASLADIVSFSELNKTTTPTREDCVALAKRLGVRTSAG